MNLKEKIFVITGGSGYIGQAIVKEIILSGGKAIIISRNVRKANNFINKLSPYQKNKCYFIKGDLTKEKDLFRIKKNISKNFRYINGIVNNAYSGKTGPVNKSRKKDFENAMNINMYAPFRIILDLKQLMLKGALISKDSSSIVNIGSMYGLVSSDRRIYKNKKNQNPIEYGASKAALNQITKYLACNLSPEKIRVNSISLGPFPDKKVNLNLKKNIIKKVPLGRFGEAAEAAKPIAFLLSSESSFINGSNLIVDGGWTSW